MRKHLGGFVKDSFHGKRNKSPWMFLRINFFQVFIQNSLLTSIWCHLPPKLCCNDQQESYGYKLHYVNKSLLEIYLRVECILLGQDWICTYQPNYLLWTSLNTTTSNLSVFYLVVTLLISKSFFSIKHQSMHTFFY